MAKVRVAIDGCGALTRETILHHLDQPDFRDVAEVVAVCDIVPELAKAAAEEHGVPPGSPTTARCWNGSSATPCW